MTESLGTALPIEIQRVGEIMGIYRTIPSGLFAASAMALSLEKAHAAIASGDIAAMILALEDLRGYSL